MTATDPLDLGLSLGALACGRCMARWGIRDGACTIFGSSGNTPEWHEAARCAHIIATPVLVCGGPGLRFAWAGDGPPPETAFCVWLADKRRLTVVEFEAGTRAGRGTLVAGWRTYPGAVRP